MRPARAKQSIFFIWCSSAEWKKPQTRLKRNKKPSDWAVGKLRKRRVVVFVVRDRYCEVDIVFCLLYQCLWSVCFEKYGFRDQTSRFMRFQLTFFFVELLISKIHIDMITRWWSTRVGVKRFVQDGIKKSYDGNKSCGRTSFVIFEKYFFFAGRKPATPCQWGCRAPPWRGPLYKTWTLTLAPPGCTCPR